jgi:hypothetical protein
LKVPSARVHGEMLYAAKCYWPAVTRTQVEEVAARAAGASTEPSRDEVAYLGSLLFAGDDLVLCLFEGRSRAAVKHATERAGMPSERIMDAVWLDARRTTEPERGSEEIVDDRRTGGRKRDA